MSNRPVDESEVDLERFFEFSIDMLCVAGRDGYFRRVNPAFALTLGYDQDDFLSRPFIDFVHPDDRDATVRELQRLERGERTLAFENRYRCKDGRVKVIHWNAFPDGSTGLIYAVARDVTDHRRMQRELEALARTDELTGLLNRRAFNEALTDEWSRAARMRTSLAVALADVDGLKSINDRHGHATGDVVLENLGSIFRGHVARAGDSAARYGGDEFGFVFAGTGLPEAREHCEHIRQVVASAVPEEASVPVTISIGVAAAMPGKSDGPDNLLARADAALYEAKKNGRNQVVGREREVIQ